MSNKGLSEEAEDNNCGVCHKDINVQNMCRRREYGGVQCVLKVVVPRTRPHTGREVGRVKDK